MKKLPLLVTAILTLTLLALVGCKNVTEDPPVQASAEDIAAVGTAITDLVFTSGAVLSGTDTLDTITGTLTLPTTGTDGTTITWASDTTAVIAADGTVTRPAAGSGNATVVLTATITKGGATETKTFTVTVLQQANPADVTAVGTAKIALVLTFAGSETLSTVATSLTLPLTGTDGTTITWSSNTPAVIAANGTVNRPAAGSSNATVVLTATIVKGGATETKTFTVTVLAAPATFASATTPGDAVPVTVGAQAVTMKYANNLATITFPYTTNGSVDSNNGTATLTRKFFMADSEVTNALMVEVLNWAFTNGSFTTTAGPNAVYWNKAYQGGQVIIDYEYTPIAYDAGVFTVDAGYENRAVGKITWYGAIMFCNWLTVMRDGNTSNIVYTGADTDWIASETAEDASKSGYRLPSNEEWEFAARYIGTTAPTTGNLATEYIAQSLRGGAAGLTAGYYWTPGLYASGATKDVTNLPETRAVAWYAGDAAMPADPALKGVTVKQKAPNQLGLYDMIGSFGEWVFNADLITPANRVQRYSNVGSSSDGRDSKVGRWMGVAPDNGGFANGLRFARTQ